MHLGIFLSEYQLWEYTGLRFEVSDGDNKFDKKIQNQGTKMGPTLLGVHLDVVEMLGGEAGGVGALQLAVRVLQLAVGTLQLAVGAFQLAVGTL